ncbi:MAG TPA: hypothetical protein DCY07_00060 [Rhodospirillaceae bacterium]|nr:hypothetical protein [Rhodospirillaceae bacterium]
MKSSVKTIALLCLLSVTGCVPVWQQWGKPAKPAKAYSVLPAHENWCYSTLGAIECYPAPQRFPPESLVSVDPPSRFPLTREAHAKALAETLKPAE